MGNQGQEIRASCLVSADETDAHACVHSHRLVEKQAALHRRGTLGCDPMQKVRSPCVMARRTRASRSGGAVHSAQPRYSQGTCAPCGRRLLNPYCQRNYVPIPFSHQPDRNFVIGGPTGLTGRILSIPTAVWRAMVVAFSGKDLQGRSLRRLRRALRCQIMAAARPRRWGPMRSASLKDFQHRYGGTHNDAIVTDPEHDLRPKGLSICSI